MGKDCVQKIVEMGEQVLAKPKRSRTSTRKQALVSRWKHAIWVGMSERSNEHVVVLAEGGPAIKVRTIKRKPITDRWSAEAIDNIKATPRRPKPQDEEQPKVQYESNTQRIEVDIGGDGAAVPDV